MRIASIASKPRAATRVGLLFAAVAIVLPLLEAAVEVHGSEGVPHSHDGPRRVAVEAVHHSQPAHFDASAIRTDRACAVCATHSRIAEPARTAAQLRFAPPGFTGAGAASDAVPSRPRLRRDHSRAPPLFL